MILCITPNPAVDRTLLVPGLRLGEPQRAANSIVAAGGKGLNVARVARALGGAVVCAGFLGGHSGRLVADLAARDGLIGDWTWIAGETRTCTIIVGGRAHDATVINEPGPAVASDDWAHLADQAVHKALSAAAVCVSGSMPPGSAPADYALMLRQLRDTGCPVWADTSGPALAAARAVGGVSLKINAAEAAELLGRSIATPAEAHIAARELHSQAGAAVVLTLGGAGAVLAGAEGSWHARPPEVAIVSTVGSGDAFLAGLVVALTRALPPPEALRYAVAAGAANAMSVGGGRIDLDCFRELLAGSLCEPLR